MKKVLLLLANGFEAYEASVFTDILGWNQAEGDGSTQLITCGRREKLQCTWNLIVTPEILLSSTNATLFDALALPGGFEEAGFYEDAYSDDFLAIIRDFDKANKPIASICVGALPLGKSGVLYGRQGTTYHLNDSQRQDQLSSFGVKVIHQPIVIDQNIITSSSPATALNVAFTFLEMLTSSENCEKVKSAMGF